MDLPGPIKKADETLRRELKKIPANELIDAHFYISNENDKDRIINELSLEEIMSNLIRLERDLESLKGMTDIELLKSKNGYNSPVKSAPEALVTIKQLSMNKQSLLNKIRSNKDIDFLFMLYMKRDQNIHSMQESQTMNHTPHR